MKKLARTVVAKILGYQVRQLSKKNDFKVIAVAGSIGKTSTKLAIASVLKAGLRVRYQDGNYNDLVSVPLVFFGQELPSLFNPLAWLAVFWRNQSQLRRDYPYDVVVLELGSDGPGQIRQFKSYLNLDIGVISAITPEHMLFFGSLDAVAKEELAIGEFSSLLLANQDLSAKKYLDKLPKTLTYSMDRDADYKLNLSGDKLTINAGTKTLLEQSAGDLSQPELYSLLAAVAAADKLGLGPEAIKQGVKNIKSVPGRMQKLDGIAGSTIIDDSYNSSPDAVKLALDTLYKMETPQKIAVLGNMNELGDYAKQAHQEIGAYCDPKQLDLVVTIGPEANEYLAAAAEAKGCNAQRFDSPYEAGEYIKPLVKHGAVILVKGSQNRVFAEEAIKSLLAKPADNDKLVRQSRDWLKIKEKAFKR